MKRNKLWLSLTEAAQVLECTADDLLYQGLIGELNLSFDWVIIRNENNLINMEKRPYFNFLEIFDICPCPYTGEDREQLTPTELPNYNSNPLLRLATLTSDDIGLIKKNGQVTLRKAMLAKDNQISVDCREFIDAYCNNYDDNEENYTFPVLKVEDVVVESSYIEALKASQKIEQNPVPESPREIENLLRMIGLLCIALDDKSGNSLKHGENLSAKAIASKLELYIPEGLNINGLSLESLRKKISAGLYSVDPKNN